MGYLEVVVPPDFIAEETSGDVMVPEGGMATLSCRARGIPSPRVMWRREDGSDIVIRFANGSKSKIAVYEDEVLTLNKISRSDMGAYLCIASNGVPPSVSKRMLVKVHFHPVIQVPNQLVGAPLGTDVTLECYVESSPKSINYWVRDSNDMVISSSKYEVTTTMLSSFESRMTLVVRQLADADLGGYRCIAKNSLGEVDGTIRLYGITRQLMANSSPTSRNEDFSTPIQGPDNQFGSAERSDDEDETATDTSDSYNSNDNYSYKNKTFLNSTPDPERQNVSNKVRKIISDLKDETMNRSRLDAVVRADLLMLAGFVSCFNWSM
ncbi:unnamed protein product [Leptosia nina]|uniref:Ig-like domain-containing protein n=1 Tax=Leptosia nina TaxID=320188 RepID=A0AAV1J8V8_9NEOP